MVFLVCTYHQVTGVGVELTCLRSPESESVMNGPGLAPALNVTTTSRPVWDV
jgi:hypothetical protein